MQASDCYALGSSLVREKNFKYAVSWLLEARAKLAKEAVFDSEGVAQRFPIIVDAQILQELVPATIHNGNIKLTQRLAQEHLEIDGSNAQALEAFNNAAQQLREQRAEISHRLTAAEGSAQSYVEAGYEADDEEKISEFEERFENNFEKGFDEEFEERVNDNKVWSNKRLKGEPKLDANKMKKFFDGDEDQDEDQDGIVTEVHEVADLESHNNLEDVDYGDNDYDYEDEELEKEQKEIDDEEKSSDYEELDEGAYAKLDATLYSDIDKQLEDQLDAELAKLKQEKVEEKLPSVKKLYEKTCRGELTPSPKDQRELRCKYAHNQVPFCQLARFKVEELSLDPYVAIYYNVIYESEMTNIIKASENYVTRSRIGSEEDTSSVSDIRTSKNTWLDLQEFGFLKHLSRRLVHITGLSLESAEWLQVANYGIGGHYGPHYDFAEEADFDYGGKGNRILTALFYINQPKMGGATAFPFLRLAVPPLRGSLVMWHNMHKSLERDYRTKHAACPVIVGSKWICNEWFHVMGQELLRPCSLTQEGHKSIRYKEFV